MMMLRIFVALVLLITSYGSCVLAAIVGRIDEEQGDDRIVIIKNTTWSAETLQKNSIALDKKVEVFPGATLTIQGIDNRETNNNNNNNVDPNFNNEEKKNSDHDDGSFVIVFLTQHAVITLHDGARIRLVDVTFMNVNQNSTATTTAQVISMGQGVETLGTKSDFANQGVVVYAQRLKCRFLSRCITSEGQVQVYDSQFYLKGPSNFAIRSSADVRVENSSFYNFQNSSGIRPSDYNVGGNLNLIDSYFQSDFFEDLEFQYENDCVGYSLYDKTAVRIADYSSMMVHRTTFVGYYVALRAGGDGHDSVQNCTFVGNKCGVLGNDGGYQSRGIVRGSYFWRNGMAQMGHDAKQNYYVENAVAFLSTRTAVDLVLSRNLVGFWSNSMYGGWDTFEDIPDDARRVVSNITFLDNVVAVLDTILIPSAGAMVNFMGSILYHINYTGTSTVELTDGVYWSNDGSNRTSTEEDVRLKVRDGFHGNPGSGVVLLNITSSPLTPYLHSTFPLKEFIPPSLAKWRNDKQLTDTTRMVEQIVVPPLPNSMKLGLPEKLTSENISFWWSNNKTQSDGNSNGVFTPKCSNMDKLDNPNQVATVTTVNVQLQTDSTTCDELASLTNDELSFWCSAPDSTAAASCPHTCCGAVSTTTSGRSVGDGTRSKNNNNISNTSSPFPGHSYDNATSSLPDPTAGDSTETIEERNIVYFWVLRGLGVVYLLILHVLVAYWYICQQIGRKAHLYESTSVVPVDEDLCFK